MSIEIITDGIIDLIKKNIIAKTNVTSDVTTGDVIVNVENSYRFHAKEEVVLIDWGYNDKSSPHYNSFEYAKIKTVNNTRSVTLTAAVQSNWLVSQNAFMQKTIGHSPLYEDNVLYGDREVIPIEDMAVTVEPVSLTNDWIYIQGGLDEDYKIRIMIYGKSIDVDSGRRILDRYSWSIYSLLNSNLHMDVNDYDTPLLEDYINGSYVVVVEDTDENREYFTVVDAGDPSPYMIQDNLNVTCWARITDVSYGGGKLYLTLDRSFGDDYTLSEFAVLRKVGDYIYDSRADNVDFGKVSKQSAFLRAAEISWFGKKVNRHYFPQTSDGVDDFAEIDEPSSSSSSSL